MAKTVELHLVANQNPNPNRTRSEPVANPLRTKDWKYNDRSRTFLIIARQKSGNGPFWLERFFWNQVKPEPLWRNDGSFWSSNTPLRCLAVRAVSIIGFIFNISTSDFERTEDLVIFIIVRNRNSAYYSNTRYI